MMNIEIIVWKNIQGIQLENELLKVVVLPLLGGKIASMVYKEKDFQMSAQHEGDYVIPNIDSAFEKCDASGIDDAFPNINDGIINLNGRTLNYTDHGEIWRSSFDYIIENEKLILTYESKEQMYMYQKTIYLEASAVKIDYSISNLMEDELPCFWTMHGLVRYEEDMTLLYPNGVDKIVNVQDSNELGDDLKEYHFKNTDYDFTKVPTINSNTFVKYYLADEVQEGTCGYVYPTQGVQCLLNFDKEKLPYLGFWLTAGKFRGDYNCAFEPTNGYYDGMDIAVKNNKYYVLKQNEPLSFSVDYTFSKI